MAFIRVPEWVYDLFVYAFFPLNWFLTLLPTRLPFPYNRPDWTLDPSLLPGAITALDRPGANVAKAVRARAYTRLDDTELWRLFDSLPAPATNDLLGNWRGRVVYSGGWLDLAGWALERPANLVGWDWGKRFFSPHTGDPLVFILWKRLVVPIPWWGNVSLPEIAFRGKSGATMRYDHHPWQDHFRVLDDGSRSGRRMLLGNWMVREKMGGWFSLEETIEASEAMRDLLVPLPSAAEGN